MRVLIFGGDGMLGHTLARTLTQLGFEVAVTVRGSRPAFALPASVCVYPHIDVRNSERVEALLPSDLPDAVINAVGVVKHRLDAIDLAVANEVNAVFPHKLAGLCRDHAIRLIHVSTDCVFDGKRGFYDETDPVCPTDDYGRTKARGEVSGPDILTLRTSMIGLPGSSGLGLLGWFLGERGPVHGFSRAIFSGPTTPELSRIIGNVLKTGTPRAGLYHVAAPPIDKFTLLELVSDVFGLEAPILAREHPMIDRSLNAARFNAETGYVGPDWPTMITELARLWDEDPQLTFNRVIAA